MRRAASDSGAPPSLRVVLYHHLTDHASSLVDRLAVSTPPEVFESHVRKMAREYEFVSLEDVLSGELPRRAVLITFDDGYRSVAEVALPILRRLGVPSVFFVTGACLERDSLPLDNLLSHCCASIGLDRLGAALDPDWRGRGTFAQLLRLVAAMSYGRRLRLGDELAERFELDQARLRSDSRIFLDPEDLPGLAAYGCEVGNHTRTHLFCRSIVDETVAQDQLVEHARRLEGLTGRPIRAFSYPYGCRDDATPLVERVLRASGHEGLFLAESRPHVVGALGRLWNRVALDGCPAWRIRAELELMPAMRARRDRLRKAAGLARRVRGGRSWHWSRPRDVAPQVVRARTRQALNTRDPRQVADPDL
jgi:peptidoglycan/xylan/chitin deacetylase (PgdA/CDA1 family)